MKPTSTVRSLSPCAWIMSVASLACLSVPILCAAQQSPTPASSTTKGIPAGVKTFDTSQQAADALVRAADQFDETALAQIFGPDGHDIAFTGDVVQDRQRAAEFSAEAREKTKVSVEPKNGLWAYILVGNEDWPFPVPIVKRSNRWFFDSNAGRQEILNRRIGSNELDAINISHDYVMDLVAALRAQDLQVEHVYPELGHGQQEVVIRYAPALRAADNHVLYRETVRGVALRHGLWASLAPKPIPDQAGNGTHLHASLTDLATGQQAFTDPAGRYGLSQVGYHFIGGLLAHLPALVALTCGSVNSYRRLQPGFWSSAFVAYGADNREAAVRICSPLAGGSVNLELKPSDSTGNPYLALGAFIHAGLDGLARQLDPGEPVNVDPATLSDSERSSLGVRRLPQTLADALAELEADRVLMDALGPLRSRAYLAVKRSEVAAFAEHDTDWECYHHFTKF